ncbi:MAG: hypothetical protein ABWX94_02120 [Candidatus Saccharimonadales bacterium]
MSKSSPEQPWHYDGSPVLQGPQAEVLHNVVSTVFAETGDATYDNPNVAHLVGFDGTQITIERTPKVVPEVDEAKTSVGGLFKRLTSIFRPSKTQPEGVDDPYDYDVMVRSSNPPESNIRIGLFVSSARKRRGPSVTGAEQLVLVDDTKTTFLHALEMTGHIPSVVDSIANSVRLDEATLLEVEQLSPCTDIAGKEADEVYYSVSPTVTRLFDSKEPTDEPAIFVKEHISIRDRSDDLPIAGLNAVRVEFGHEQSIQIIFAEHPFSSNHSDANNGLLVVDIHRAIVNTKTQTQVGYRLVHYDRQNDQQTDEPLALNPAMRKRVHKAIDSQVTPDNLREME